MRKGTKVLLNIVYSIIAIALLAATLFLFLTPGVPVEKIQEDGSSVSALSFPNGEYTGQSVLGILEGTGTFTFSSGEVYEGQWEQHQMTGTGTLTSNAGVYEGQFTDSARTGEGTFVWSDGSEYIGQWKDDKLNGEGKMTTASGLTYEGTFQDNTFYEGKISGTQDEIRFEFTVESGNVTDQITITFADGVTYTGGFVGTCFSGNGTMTFPGVGKYEGSFAEGKRSGYGTFTWEDGTEYDGKWEADLMDGYGTYTFDATTSITGTFQDGVLNGSYTYKNADGEFQTIWENGTCTSVKAK